MENIHIQNSSIRSDICRRCNKKLKSPESIEMGFGPTCYKKFIAESLLKPLFEVKKDEPSTEKAEDEKGSRKRKNAKSKKE